MSDDATFLNELANNLADAERFREDDSDSEGVRVIHIRDTHAKQIAERLWAIAERMTNA